MSRALGRMLVGVAAAAVSVLVLAACGSTKTVVRVTPELSLENEPVDIRVTGLSPHERVTLWLRSTDARGVVWRSHALYSADPNGVLDTSVAAPLSGSYVGRPWQLGLIASMTTAKSPDALYFWEGSRPLTFDLTVQPAGRATVRTTFRRTWSRVHLVARQETLAAAGFDGEYVAPSGVTKRPAVLVFGGSEGGLATVLLAARLAADGVPALALAYFNYDGLPPNLKDIPLEYFGKALAWLAQQPEVDPARMAVLGASRGSEAALLLGVHYPDLVHGVVALVPSSVVNCGIPSSATTTPGCLGSAWTFGGKPIPYTLEFNSPAPTDVPAAVIPVEEIQAPILLACGNLDSTWGSCPFSQAIQKRLRLHHRPEARLYAYPQAGHTVGALLPDEPGRLALDQEAPADELARERLYPRVLAFLRGLPG